MQRIGINILRNHYLTKINIICIWFILPFILNELPLLLFDIVLSIILIYFNKKYKLLINPLYIIIFILLHYLIVFPFCNELELLELKSFTLKIWSLMNIGLFMGTYLNTEDYIFILRKLQFNEQVIKVFVAFVNFIPESMRSIKLITESQKSRGLNISFKNIFNFTAFEFITIPFIMFTLRSIYYTSINISIRKLEVSNPCLSFGFSDLFIILFTLSLICINFLSPNIV